MSERDPVQRALDGARLSHDAYRAGQLEGLRGAVAEFERLTEDLRRRIREIEAGREEGFFADLQRRLPTGEPDETD